MKIWRSIMKVKTSELSGRALYHAVKMAIGMYPPIIPSTDMQVKNCRLLVEAKIGDEVEIPDEIEWAK